jgi:hypothetical protein
MISSYNEKEEQIMSKLKIGGYICAAAGFVIGLVADAISQKETEDYVDQKVLEREQEMVQFAVDEYMGDAIDTAVAKRFLAVATVNPNEVEET